MKYILACIVTIILTSNISYSQSFSRNDVAINLASTYMEANSGIWMTGGLSYEFIFKTDPKIGLGFISDFINENNLIINGMLAIYMHPMKNMRVYLGSGISYVDVGVAPLGTGVSELDQFGKQVNILTRIGIDYNFKVGVLNLRPNIAFNLLKDEYSILFGVMTGVNF